MKLCKLILHVGGRGPQVTGAGGWGGGVILNEEEERRGGYKDNAETR